MENIIKTANLTGSISRKAGGLFESVRRLVQSLAENGMDVRVFGSEDEHTAADIGQWAPVQAQAFRPILSKQFGYSPQFLRALEAFAPDLVHTHGIWLYSSVATNQYRRRRKTPYVISAHGMLDPWAVRHSRWKKMIAHFFYEGAHLREASCLRALCEDEARAIRQLGLKNPIAIIPNGIDLPVIPKAETLKAPWADLVQPGQKVLLFLSRIHPKKGLVNLIKAWHHNRQSDTWVLAIAGWDQVGHEAELKQLCDELGIEWQDIRDLKSEVTSQTSNLRPPPSVVFLGPQFNEGKAACYAHCDGFILPSFSEGVPMVVQEAWAYSKPVLMTPECNLPAGFARDAAICIETNADSIAHGLQGFFQASEGRRRDLGENGKRLVCEQFLWPVLGREMTELYRWLLGGGDKPRCMF